MAPSVVPTVGRLKTKTDKTDKRFVLHRLERMPDRRSCNTDSCTKRNCFSCSVFQLVCHAVPASVQDWGAAAIMWHVMVVPALRMTSVNASTEMDGRQCKSNSVRPVKVLWRADLGGLSFDAQAVAAWIP